ncbi:uncharacterized protein LOC144435602 [Glandiceps talaboti]
MDTEANSDSTVITEGTSVIDPADLKQAPVKETPNSIHDELEGEQTQTKENGPVNGIASDANGSTAIPTTHDAVKSDTLPTGQNDDDSKETPSEPEKCPQTDNTTTEKPISEETNKVTEKSPDKDTDKDSRTDTPVSPKAKSEPKSAGKEKEPARSKEVANGKEKKPAAPRKQVSSRLFAPTASSLRKHSDKIETPGQGPLRKTINKDKSTAAKSRPRPVSASPSKTAKPSTPRARPISAPPTNKRGPSSADRKQTPRRTTPRPMSTTTSRTPRDKITTGPGTKRPASTTSTAPARTRSAPSNRKTTSPPTARTPSTRRPVTTATSSPTRTTSATTRRTTRTTTGSSPTRPTSTTTRRTTTATTGSSPRTTPAGSSKRTVTTVTTRTVMKDGASVPSSNSRTSRTTTQTRPGSGRTRPASGTTRTVTSSSRTQHGSPKKSSSGNRPAILNLSPKENIAPPVASPRPSHSPPGRYAVIDHNDTCRADTVLNRLNEFRENQLFTDLILHVKENEIICHRMVMAACCSYFRDTLCNTFTAKTDIIDMRGVQASILKTVVDYAYKGQISVPKRTVPSLLEAAELFQIDTLISACKAFVTHGDSPPKSPGRQSESDKDSNISTGDLDTKDQSGSESESGVKDSKNEAEYKRSDNFNYCDRHHNSKLLHTLNEFRPVNAFVDVVLKSGHEVLPCHRALLAASSEHFMLWFTEKLKSDQVPIPEIKPDMLRKLVDFAYTSKFAVTERELYRFFDGARKLQMTDAWKGCLTLMSRILSVQTCLRTLKAAETAGQSDLATRARAFSLQHFIEACQYDYFPHINKERLIDLISSDELRVPKEEMVYEAIVSWVRYDRDNRKALLSDVLAQIRFKFMSESYVTETVLNDDMISKNDDLKEKIEQWRNAESKPRIYEGSVLSRE